MAKQRKRKADITVKIPADTYAIVARLARTEQRAIRIVLARAVDLYSIGTDADEKQS